MQISRPDAGEMRHAQAATAGRRGGGAGGAGPGLPERRAMKKLQWLQRKNSGLWLACAAAAGGCSSGRPREERFPPPDAVVRGRGRGGGLAVLQEPWDLMGVDLEGMAPRIVQPPSTMSQPAKVLGNGQGWRQICRADHSCGLDTSRRRPTRTGVFCSER